MVVQKYFTLVARTLSSAVFSAELGNATAFAASSLPLTSPLDHANARPILGAKINARDAS
jgi:hypothetical protein